MATREELLQLKQSIQKQYTLLADTLVNTETRLLQQIDLLINNINVPPVNTIKTDIDEDLAQLKIDIINDKDYVVTDLFCTYNGNWDVNPNQKYSIKQRFRDKFLKPINDPLYIDDGGAQKHLLVGIYDWNNVPVINQSVFYNTKDQLNPYTTNTKNSGWANMQMSPSSAFWPDSGQTGFWYITIPNTTLRVSGLGLINKHHISIYVAIKKIN